MMKVLEHIMKTNQSLKERKNGKMATRKYNVQKQLLMIETISMRYAKISK